MEWRGGNTQTQSIINMLEKGRSGRRTVFVIIENGLVTIEMFYGLMAFIAPPALNDINRQFVRWFFIHFHLLFGRFLKQRKELIFELPNRLTNNVSMTW